MAISYTEARNRALSGDFLGPLAVALCVYAHTVAAESDLTPNHAARLALAVKVAKDPTGVAARLGFLLASHPTIIAVDVGTVPDATLASVVAAYWNALAVVEA